MPSKSDTVDVLALVVCGMSAAVLCIVTAVGIVFSPLAHLLPDESILFVGVGLAWLISWACSHMYRALKRGRTPPLAQ